MTPVAEWPTRFARNWAFVHVCVTARVHTKCVFMTLAVFMILGWTLKCKFVVVVNCELRMMI